MKNLSNPVVFSAFDGISCGRVALERAGINVSLYFASELIVIDGRINPSVLITQSNYPDTVQLGDICQIDGKPLRGRVDIFFGGSPCQSFSNAGQRNGFEGKSKLFYEFVRLLEEINPTYFLLENVVMKKQWEHIISNILGVDPIHINSSLVSGQNRPRTYWTNIPYTPIKDHEILLSDVIQGAVTGASKHGARNPNYGVIPDETKWKSKDWKFNPNNKSRCLVRSTGHYLNIQGEIVKLTPENCEKLQTLPVGYTKVHGICNTDRIKALGDAWTVDVLVKAFFKNLPWALNYKDKPIYFSEKV
jgi:DNA (cytosine-5)-methyltransferase 3A